MSIESPYEKDIDVIRVVVLIEEKPFNNKYRQIWLTRKQYQAVTDIIWGTMPKNPITGAPVIMASQNVITTLPEEIESHYD